MSMLRLGIVIVHYGDPSITKYSLASFITSARNLLKDKKGNNVKILILVIDNYGNLSDLNLRFKEELSNGLRIISYKASRNLGYAGACTLGAKLLIETHKVDYLLFSNNDVFVHEDCLAELLATAERLKSFGLLQPIVLKAKFEKNTVLKTNKIDSLGSICSQALENSFNYSNWPLRPSNVIKFGDKVLFEVPIVDGMIFLVSAKNYVKAKGFDPEFFMFNEDIFLSLKMLSLGLRNYVLLNAKAWHIRGATAKGTFVKEPIFTSYYTARNAILTLLSIYDVALLLPSLAKNFIMRILKCAYLTYRHFDPKYWYYLILVLTYLFKNSKRIANLRSLTPKLTPREVRTLIKSNRMLKITDALRLLISYRDVF